MQEPTSLTQLGPLVLFMVAMLVMFWFMVIRPAKARQQRHVSLIDSIKEGDEIVTVGGIYGKIIKLREDTVEVEIAPNVRIKLDRRALRRRASEKEL